MNGDLFRMKPGDIAAELARHTYKPGYRLWLDTHAALHTGMPALTASFRATDSRNPGVVTEVARRTPVPPAITGDTLPEWVHRMLGELEWHEMEEWHRVDGELFRDPHAR